MTNVPPSKLPPITPSDHAKGAADAPVKIIEYGDYQCPHCGAAHPILAGLLAQYGESIHFVFRNFPLMKIHPEANVAAQSAEAAAAQGKFWEMHDMLFTHQDDLRLEHLLEYARELALDVERVRAEIESGKYAERVRSDLSGGIRAGVNGTPTIFINGIRQNGYQREVLAAGIETALSGR